MRRTSLIGRDYEVTEGMSRCNAIEEEDETMRPRFHGGSLVWGAVFLVLGQQAQALTVSEARQVSQKTGRPILAVAGTAT